MKILLLLFLASPAFSQVTYTYQGQALTNNGQVGGPVDNSLIQPPYAATQITGSITLAQPLAANLSNATVTPTSASFSDGLTPLINQTVYPTFVFSTDSNGYITAWHITLYSVGANDISTVSFATLLTDKGDSEFYTNVCFNATVCEQWLSASAGAWNQPGVTPDPPPPNPQVAALQAQVTAQHTEILAYSANLLDESMMIGDYRSAYLTEAAMTASYRAVYLTALSTIAACRANAGKC